MKTISGFSAEDTIGAVALGTFDGVHIGHQAIIREAISRAAGIGRSAVLTTNPHPLRVIAPEHAPGLLTPMPLMQRVVSSLGVDNLYVAEFTREFARLSPRDFVVEVLVKGLRTKHVVVGYNYTFGYRGEGDADMLRELGASFQMGVTVVDPVIVDDAPVSSSRIRVAVQEGELDLCRRMLGRSSTSSSTRRGSSSRQVRRTCPSRGRAASTGRTWCRTAPTGRGA
jgi:riboflavin kinase/FMN adenylyltransferase